MQVQVYSAESRVKNLRSVLRDMIRGVLTSRYLAYRLARNSIKGQYSQSALGFLWDFADPLVLGCIFILLYRHKVFETGDVGMPYFIFVIFGLLMYQTFSSSVMESASLLRRSRGLITQQKLAPEALMISVFLQVGFFSLFRVAVMILLAASAAMFGMLQQAESVKATLAPETSVAPSQLPAAEVQADAVRTGPELHSFSPVGTLAFLAGFPALILAGMAIGLFLAPFNAIYNDVGRFIAMVLVPLRFVSPVLFPLDSFETFQITKYFNPFWTIMDNLRLLATSGRTDDLWLAALHCAVFLLVGLAGWFVFHISVPVLAERA